MSRPAPRISIDQVRAFVELAHSGSMRAAAGTLALSEEGLRSRILALEERTGTALYEKERGRRGAVRLTDAGRTFLDRAIRFLEEVHALTDRLAPTSVDALKIAASEYVTLYLLADVLQTFHARYPDVLVHISTRLDQQVASTLRTDPSFAVGICAPEEFTADLMCRSWISMNWCLIAPLDSPLLQKSSVTLEEVARENLIVFEPGSPVRRHVLEAFRRRGLAATIVSEVTSMLVATHLVGAGLGVAIVPTLASRAVTDGMKAGQIPISDPIRKIENAILTRAASQNDASVQMFVNHLLSHEPSCTSDNRRNKLAKLPTGRDWRHSRAIGSTNITAERHREPIPRVLRWSEFRQAIDR